MVQSAIKGISTDATVTFDVNGTLTTEKFQLEK